MTGEAMDRDRPVVSAAERLSSEQGAPYGWRARIGFITPSAVVENNAFEFYLMAPRGVTIALTPMGMDVFAPGAAEDFLGRLPAATRELVNRKVNVLVQAGVPQVVTGGWGFEDRVRETVAQVTDALFATDIGACIDAMHALGMRRVAMLTPFDDALHGHLSRYVANAGIEVVAARSCRTPEFADFTIAPLAYPYRAARDLFRSTSGADGIWITGAALPSVGMIEALETDLGAPVVSSMQAMFWAGLRLAGVSARIEGYGRLLRESD
jgi:maleate cis-trans isomerase